jgi:endonuclease/exonuclease/phosphatase family metal-dependent hydrolase
MRRPATANVAVCLGVLVLVDILRVWLPAIITIFGQAASTPAELMGAFALLWFLLPLAVPALLRRAGAGPVAPTAVVVLAVARLALTATPGGQLQLYLASVGLLAGLVWLTATAHTTVRPVPGLVLGLALGTIAHTVLGTYDLVWRGGWAAWTVSVVLVGLLVAVQARTPTQPVRAADAEDSAGVADTWPAVVQARSWLLVGPTVLLSGMVALSPALAGATTSYLFGAPTRRLAESTGGWGLPEGTLIGLAVGLFVLTALSRPHRSTRWWGPLALVVGVLLFAIGWIPALAPAILLTAAGLGACLALAGATTGEPAPAGSVAARRRSYAAAGGMLVFVVAAIAYYAAYDLGYPNGWAPVAVAGLVAVQASRPAPGAARDTPSPALRRAASMAAGGRAGRLAAALTALTVLGAVQIPGDSDDPARRSAADPIRLVAYNIRMGFGLDGRFDLAGLVDVVAGEKPDVVVLSEVDRAWLLNGGHDTLALLARRLDLPYVFAPAADPVWGDAVLTRIPVRHAETRALPAVGAPTGAQALAVTLDLDGRELVVVSTHLQPPPDEGPVVQARAVASFATGYAGCRPLVVAGDLNTEPGEPAFAEFIRADLVDALADARPLPTSPADAPDGQIDHVLVSGGITPRDAVAPRSTASDHLAVAVTLAIGGGC